MKAKTRTFKAVVTGRTVTSERPRVAFGSYTVGVLIGRGEVLNLPIHMTDAYVDPPAIGTQFQITVEEK